MRWISLVGLSVLSGCVTLRPAPLPPARDAMSRTSVRPGAQRCGGASCRTTVHMGGERFTVETHARLMSREKALGERRSVPATVATSVVGEVLVLAGATVGRDQIGLGTRVVERQGDPAHQLRCQDGWLQEETRTRVDGNDVYAVQRLAEGMDCELVRTTDSLVTWRFHAGASPDPRGLVTSAGSARGDTHRPRLDTQFRLVQVHAPSATEYRVQLDSVTTSVSHAPLSVWGVLRPDGQRVATLYWRYGVGSSAMDLSLLATDDERRVLHYALAALAIPSGETR